MIGCVGQEGAWPAARIGGAMKTERAITAICAVVVAACFVGSAQARGGGHSSGHSSSHSGSHSSGHSSGHSGSSSSHSHSSAPSASGGSKSSAHNGSKAAVGTGSTHSSTQVSGYTRKDGTRVDAH